MRIIPYMPEYASMWDSAVAESRNGIFQHYRAYMEYHSDRFDDCSLMAFDDKDRVVAVLPAHRRGNVVCSHRGLTFGGWLMTARADMPAMMEIWRLMAEHYAAQGFEELYYRPAPHIYHSYPAEEDLYALFRAGGNIAEVRVSSVVDLSCPLGFDMTCRQSVRKAQKACIVLGASSDYASFWSMLESLLRERHDAVPVHTLQEITMLQERFPDNIRLYTASLDGRLLAGVVMYGGPLTTHSQYTASTAEGRDLRVLPALYSYIMNEAAAAGVRWFDFGTSCEEAGRILNEGLVRQKCSFGARAVAYNAYTIPLR